jgi:glycosyltransferase involved in cell wall biosynthesis
MCLGKPEETGDIASLVTRIDIIARDRVTRAGRLWRYAIYALLGVPPTVAVHSSVEMCLKVKQAIETGGFDAILVYEMSGIQYCPRAALSKVVANIEDPQSLKLRRSASLSSWTWWQRIKIAISALITERYERQVFPHIGQILLLSQSDATELRARFRNSRIAAVPYGVDVRADMDILDYSGRAAGTIIFSGNMFHPANVDAILYFIRRMFPKILLSNPAAKLWIVGADPHPTITQACAGLHSNVVITGKVPDVQAYIRQSMVSICPVRLGIGVQTKVLEALSWGTPVVSTNAGNRGIQGVSGRHLWVEDDPERFAERVCSLLNGQRWKELSISGKEFARARFSWPRSAAELHEHLRAIAQGLPVAEGPGATA